MKPFVKPFIPFETFPSDYAKVWLKSDYQKCQTQAECMDFAFACLHRAEDTNNPVKERDCYSVFNFLYQKITGESYQYTLLHNKQLATQ